MEPKIKIQELTPEYAWQEYGITRKELAAAEKRVRREIAAARKAGKLVKFTGKLPGFPATPPKPAKSVWKAMPPRRLRPPISPRNSPAPSQRK